MNANAMDDAALTELAAAAQRPTVERVLIRKSEVPTYSGLLIASSMLFIYALILYGVFGVLLIVPIVSIISAIEQGRGPGPAIAVSGIALMPLAVTFFGAAMAHGASTALTALRDIAINSFRR